MTIGSATFFCANCWDKVWNVGATRKPYCSVECEIAFWNKALHNGHTALSCPEAVEVTHLSDPPGRHRYVHGDCMSPIKSFLRKPPVQPVIETDGNRIRIITVHNFTEVTYEGEIVSSELDMTRDSVALFDSMLPGQQSSQFRIDLRDVTRSERKVHADPHFLEVDRHGKFCICGCDDCHSIAGGTGVDDNCDCIECDCHDFCE